MKLHLDQCGFTGVKPKQTECRGGKMHQKKKMWDADKDDNLAE